MKKNLQNKWSIKIGGQDSPFFLKFGSLFPVSMVTVAYIKK